MPATKQELDQLALTESEYKTIIERLGREPNALELGLFGSLWSEHCGYKHSKHLLGQFKVDSPRLIVGQGTENAGAVRIGEGKAVVMKIESHNHPSAIEPYEGAATGVGGIVRDILAMGARPIGILNSLRFGPLNIARNRYLFGRVVAGISGYGNCIGIPNVGGEISFSSTYTGNPLVNAMCVGIVDEENLVRSTAGNEGNVLILVGSDTGRDGIHGASGLASRTFEEERELRPSVQVGNPFLEKILIEACLELAATNHIVGIQDLGAAGLSSASVEAANNSNAGFDIDVSKIHRRDSGMTPYEVMLSESQERMLIVARKGHESNVEQILRKWDLPTAIIGKVNGNGNARVFEGDQLKANIPVKLLVDAPQYKPSGVAPKWLKSLQSLDISSLPIPNRSPGDILIQILQSPNIASKESVFQQYDHHVQTNTVMGPGADAAVLRVKGTNKGIALTTDGNGRYCYADPYNGGMIAVAEACRNLSVVGALPIALTDCLNFGNPERPEIYYQLKECIGGMSVASKKFESPIVSGNVSLYNETQGKGIYPTPIVGALGLLEDINAYSSMPFKDCGTVLLLGVGNVELEPDSLAASEYLETVHGQIGGMPTIDLDAELAVQKACRRAIRQGLVKSAHDCSDGGLAVALAECSITGGIGFNGTIRISSRWDAALFGEKQSRIIVSVESSHQEALEQICTDENVPWTNLGTIGGDKFQIPNLIDISLEEISAAWASGIKHAAKEQAN